MKQAREPPDSAASSNTDSSHSRGGIVLQTLPCCNTAPNEKRLTMSETTKVTLETMVLLRQRIDQRIDAEIFRLTNGLFPVKETADELIDMIKTSAYAELLRADEVVEHGD